MPHSQRFTSRTRGGRTQRGNRLTKVHLENGHYNGDGGDGRVVLVEQRHSRGSSSPTVALKFRVEDRIECMQSHKVKYNYRDDYELALPIPLEAASNKGLSLYCTADIL